MFYCWENKTQPNKAFFFPVIVLQLITVAIYVYVLCVPALSGHKACLWRSDRAQLVEVVFSFHSMGSGHWTRVLKPVGKRLSCWATSQAPESAFLGLLECFNLGNPIPLPTWDVPEIQMTTKLQLFSPGSTVVRGTILFTVDEYDFLPSMSSEEWKTAVKETLVTSI